MCGYVRVCAGVSEGSRERLFSSNRLLTLRAIDDTMRVQTRVVCMIAPRGQLGWRVQG